MKRLVPWLVAAGLLVAFMIGQARESLHSDRLAVVHVLGVLLDITLTVAVAGLVCLGWYLTHGTWLPFRYREEVFVEARHREQVLALTTDPKPRKEAEGVYSYAPPPPPPEEE